MVWEPFALAIVMGLLVSAAIYLVVMWPQVEPPDGDEDTDERAAAPRAGEPAPGTLSSDA